MRKHWLFLIRPALPFIAALVLIFLVLWGEIALPGAGTLWSLLGVAMGLLTIATAGWFLYRFFVLWELDIDIITNKRIINWRGGIRQPSRKETLLEKVP